MAITDIQARNAKPKEKKYKLPDGGNLYLMISTAGGKSWVYRYTASDGKRKEPVIGQYPTMTIKEARLKRDDLKRQVSNGVDVAAEKKATKLAKQNVSSNSLQAICEEWLTKFGTTKDESTNSRDRARLRNHIYPHLGDREISHITAPELLIVLRRIEEDGSVDTAHRSRSLLSQVFRYALQTGRAERDPAADLKGAIPPSVKKHHAAITEPKEIGAVIRAIDNYQGTLVVKCAIRFMARTFQRSQEIRHAEWSTIDLDKGEWRVPDEVMKKKGRGTHIVPLSRQAVAILREIQPLTGNGRYVFPNARSDERTFSRGTMLKALRGLGFAKGTMTMHGFRTMASTNLNEQGWNGDAIERQLSHVEGNAVRGAYNHAMYMDERVRFMQSWSDYLDSLAAGGAEVVSIGKKVG